jgi:hypothetical protein
MKTLPLLALGATMLAAAPAPAQPTAPSPAPPAVVTTPPPGPVAPAPDSAPLAKTQASPGGIGAGVAAAQRGAWFGGDCAAPDGMLFVTARSAALLPEEGDGQLLRIVALRDQGNGWTVATGRGALAPRLALRATGETLETALPGPKQLDTALPGEAPVTAWHRCPAMAPALALRHGEGLAFLAQLERLEAACGAGAPMAGCLEAVVAAGDVSGDRLLGPAELARLARGAAWVVAMQEDGSAGTIGAALGGGALGGVLAARLMVEMLDYDSDGKLSAAELGQDRVALPDATGQAAGAPLRTEGVGSGASALKALLDGLLER